MFQINKQAPGPQGHENLLVKRPLTAIGQVMDGIRIPTAEISVQSLSLVSLGFSGGPARRKRLEHHVRWQLAAARVTQPPGSALHRRPSSGPGHQAGSPAVFEAQEVPHLVGGHR